MRHKSARQLGSDAGGRAQALEDTGAPVKRAVEVIRRAAGKEVTEGNHWFLSVRLPRQGGRRTAAAKRVSRAHDALCGTMRLDGSPPPRPMGRNNLLEIHTYVSLRNLSSFGDLQIAP